MTDVRKKIFVIAVSTNSESAGNLLTSCFSGISSGDLQVYQVTVGDFQVNGYTKFPGTEVHRTQPEVVDILLVSVEQGDSLESEILNYASNRQDTRHRFLVDNSGTRTAPEGLEVVNSQDVIGRVTAYSELLREHETKIGNESNLVTIVEERMAFISQPNVNDSYELNKYIKSSNKFIKDLLVPFEKMLNSFSDFDLSKGQSENNGKFELAPQNKTVNGVGFTFEILLGEEFEKSNPILPLIVRDTLATVSVELTAKSSEGANELLATLENLKEMVSSMGLLQKLGEHSLNLSFSKLESSVWIDLTFGGIIGERLIHRIRALNLDKYKLSLNDLFKIQTDLNISDLWKDVNLQTVFSKLSVVDILAQGSLFNIRTFLHLIREATKLETTSSSQKKVITTVSYALLLLSTFEKLGLDLRYNHEDLKTNLLHLGDDVLGGEGASNAMIEQGTSTYTGGILPMILGTIEGIKPMLQSFGSGLSQLNADKISLEFLVPSVRLEVKVSALLPGLTEFVEANVLN